MLLYHQPDKEAKMFIPNPVFFYQLFFYITRPKTRRLIKRLEDHARSWPYLSIKTHALGGREFDLNGDEVAHVHWNGDLNILFKKELVHELLRQNLAGRHRFVPGHAVTYTIKDGSGLDAAVDLLRLSYLIHVRMAVKSDPELKAVNDRQLSELPYDRQILNLIL